MCFLFCAEGTSQAETLAFQFDAATYETLHRSVSPDAKVREPEQSRKA